MAAQSGSVVQHFLNLLPAHGGPAACDELGVGENGEGNFHFPENGVGVRVNALPAVVNGDQDALGGQLLVAQFPVQEIFHGDDGHACGFQRLHLGPERVRIHAHLRGGQRAAEIMVAQDGHPCFMLRDGNGRKGGGRNGRGGLGWELEVRLAGNGFRIRDGFVRRGRSRRFSGDGLGHGNIFIPAVGFNQFPDGHDACCGVPLDGAARHWSGCERQGCHGRQFGRKLRTGDTG